MIKYGPEKRAFLKDLIPCPHFSEYFKNLENLGGVKLKHLLEIQNTLEKERLKDNACKNTLGREDEAWGWDASG